MFPSVQNKTVTLVALMCFILLIARSSFSQDPIGESKTTFTSAQSFNTVYSSLDNTVSLPTGSVNATIPLFNLDGNTLNTSVSLSYNTTGIKITQRAGAVGLGWNLNAGGSITVEVKGVPDGYNNIGYSSNVGSTGWSSGYSWNMGKIMTTHNEYRYFPQLFYTPSAGYYWQSVQGSLSYYSSFMRRYNLIKLFSRYVKYGNSYAMDTEPDIYHFSFEGYSGKLVFDEFRSPHLIPHQNLQVSAEWGVQDAPGQIYGLNYIDKIVFVTPEGVKYIFETKELSQRFKNDQCTEALDLKYPAKYFLDKITSPSGNDEINFTYVAASDRKIESRVERRYDLIGATGTNNPEGSPSHTAYIRMLACVDSAANPVPMESSKSTYSYTKIYAPKVLALISSSKGRVSFTSGNLGVDDQSYLQTITLQDNASAQIGRFDLTYLTTPSSIARVYLKSVLEINKKPYTFSYHDKVGGTTTYLPTFTTSQDFWGYFNGATNIVGTPSVFYNGTLYAGADRSANYFYGQIGSLNKIVYPTGGSTSFVYEGNQYYNAATNSNVQVGGIRLLQKIDDDNNGTQQIKNYSYTLPSDPSRSSGTIDQMPVFHSEQNVYIREDYTGSNTLNEFAGMYSLLETYSTPVKEYGISKGSHISYQYVTVSEQNKGKTVYQFTSFSDTPDIENSVVYNNERLNTHTGNEFAFTAGPTTCYLPKSSREPERGLLKSMEEYDNAGAIKRRQTNVYETTEVPQCYLKSSTNAPYWGSYDLPIVNRIPAVRSNINYLVYKYYTSVNKGKLLIPTPRNSYSIFTNMGYFGYYELLSQWIKLKQVKEEVYDQNNATLKLTNVTDYEYSPGNLMVSKISQTNSDGRKIVTALSYPFEYQNPFDANITNNENIPALQEKYIVSPVIEKVVYEITSSGTFVLAGVLNAYNTNGLLKSTSVLELKNPLPLSNFKFSNNTQGLVPPAANLLQYNFYMSSPEYLAHGNHNLLYYIPSPQQPYAPDSRYVKKATFLYDSKDNPIQTTTIVNGSVTGPISSKIWDDNKNYLTAEVINAPIAKVGYTGFETLNPDKWGYNTSNLTNIDSKSGKSSYYGLTPITFAFPMPTGSYKFSFWAKYTGSSTIPSIKYYKYPSGGPAYTVNLSSSGWQYYETIIVDPLSGFFIVPYFTNQSGQLETIYLDDIRIHPVDAQMTTYTHKPLVGVSSSTDANGITTYYEYDNLGRISLVRNQDKNILKRYTYGFKQ